MPNSPEQSQAYNDEIDLADLIRALWQGKWLVIGVTLATLALGIAYLMMGPKTYSASLNILALPDPQADVYRELSDFGFITVDNQTLLTMFVEELNTQSGNGLQLSLTSVTPTQSRLSFPTQDPSQLTQRVADALELTNQNVNQQLVQDFSNEIDRLKRDNSRALVALELERDRAIAIYQGYQNLQIAVLTEQAQIARMIDLDVGSFSSYVNIETNYETNVETNYKPNYETHKNDIKKHNSNSFPGTEAAYLRGHVVL